MANRSQHAEELNHLRTENERLRSEHERLVLQISGGNKHGHQRNLGRKTGVVIFLILATLLLFAGNILFWTGNTIVKTDRYAKAVEPLIREEAIQTAISSYASQQLFKTIDVEQVTAEALPPRAAFLAPTIADQVQKNAQGVIMKLLSNPKFQDRWNTVQINAHERFIAQVKQNGSDGSIDLGELYTQQIVPQLKETKLAFLADKPLPPKVGSIQIVEGPWISKLETVINNIDTWRTLALLLLIAFSAAAIWLSRNRRRTTIITLGLLFSISMFVTLVCVRLAREIVANKVDPQYADAAREATQTILHPLAIQSTTILALGLIIAFIAWVSGSSKSAKHMREVLQDLLSGKLHSALFRNENSFTLWIGRNKAKLQWGVVIAISLALLIIHITPTSLLLAAAVALVMILAIEVLAAEYSPSLRA